MMESMIEEETFIEHRTEKAENRASEEPSDQREHASE